MNYNKTYNQESIGIGLTSRCNLNCPCCYSKKLKKATLTLEEVKKIVNRFHNLKKVNFGTGESILNPELKEIISFFHSRNIKMALTSNGTTICDLPDDCLKKIDEVDISIDFPEKILHDSWRKGRGIYDIALKAIERCKKLRIETSIVAVLMNINYKHFKDFKKILDKYGIYLRVNLCKPVSTNKYQLNYQEFWEAIKIITENFTLVSNSEPLLSLIAPITHVCGSPCGEDSLRIHPDQSISPCVYVDGNKISIKSFIELKKVIPEFCKKCNFVKKCQGGCLSRRIFDRRIDKPDYYCPLYRGDKVPKIKFLKIEEKDFIHSNYLCTFILK